MAGLIGCRANWLASPRCRFIRFCAEKSPRSFWTSAGSLKGRANEEGASAHRRLHPRFYLAQRHRGIGVEDQGTSQAASCAQEVEGQMNREEASFLEQKCPSVPFSYPAEAPGPQNEPYAWELQITSLESASR